MTGQLLPLELRLQTLVSNDPHAFPGGASTWARYEALVRYLRDNVYGQINAGLASLSKSPGLYTDHGPEHFDEVVKYAGKLIEPALSENPSVVQPYDLFLVLMAIRLHDAGNIEGREGHEKRTLQILTDAGNAVCSDSFERTLIANIAEAHGGKTESGDKDTISQLREVDGIGNTKCSPRAVAALVRFADEICEHRGRASGYLLTHDKILQNSLLFHMYASSIKHAIPEREQKAFKLALWFASKDLEKEFPTVLHTRKNPKLAYLLDEAYLRIAKMDAERIYCNRFIPAALRTEKLLIEIAITRPTHVAGKKVERVWVQREFTIADSGYPAPPESWKKRLLDMSGEAVAKKLTKRGRRKRKSNNNSKRRKKGKNQSRGKRR